MMILKRFLSLLLLIGCLTTVYVAEKNDLNDELQEILRYLFSIPKPTPLSTEEISGILEKAVSLSPGKDDRKLTVEQWQLAKQLQALNPKNKESCYNYKLRVAYDELKNHDHIKPKPVPFDYYLESPNEPSELSNAYLFVSDYQRKQEEYCADFLSSKASEAISSLSTTLTALGISFQDKLSKCGNQPDRLEEVAAICWHLIRTARPNLPRSRKKLSEPKGKVEFYEAYENVIVYACNHLRDKLGDLVTINVKGIVPIYNISVRRWLDVERVCERILATRELSEDLTYREALKGQSILKCFGRN